MAKSTSPRKSEPRNSGQTAPALARRSAAGAATATLIERLSRARTANEMTNIIGLKPIKGRSGPKIAY